MASTLIVTAGWLAMTGFFTWLSVRSLRTGVAPWQFFGRRFLGLKALTRGENPFAFWYLTIPTLIGAVFGTVGCIALLLALAGVFGPLDG